MGDELDQLDWLDRKLREEASYVDDAGFTSAVMQKLPARRATRSLRVLVLLFAAVLGSVGAYVLSGGGRFVYEAFARAESYSTPVILAAAAVLSVCLTSFALLTAFRRVDEA